MIVWGMYFCGVKTSVMNQAMLIWCAIAGVLLCAFLLRTLGRFYKVGSSYGRHKARHLVEFGKESEMFYVPGDADNDDED